MGSQKKRYVDDPVCTQIEEYIKAKGRVTIPEMVERFGLARSTVDLYVRDLVLHGRIIRRSLLGDMRRAYYQHLHDGGKTNGK